jgi:arginyl-tRNA synthetase
MGAVKYADLSVSHDSEYVFDFDRMLALTGNTGPYLQYHPAERALALQLLGFGTVIDTVVTQSEPHRLCAYLFDLAQAFTSFYEACPVLKADDQETRDSRLALSALTLRVLLHGLAVLGIEVPERM